MSHPQTKKHDRITAQEVYTEVSENEVVRTWVKVVIPSKRERQLLNVARMIWEELRVLPAGEGFDVVIKRVDSIFRHLQESGNDLEALDPLMSFSQIFAEFVEIISRWIRSPEERSAIEEVGIRVLGLGRAYTRENVIRYNQTPLKKSENEAGGHIF